MSQSRSPTSEIAPEQGPPAPVHEPERAPDPGSFVGPPTPEAYEADLRERLTAYADAAGASLRRASEAQSVEADFAQNLGFFGGAIDLFSGRRPDPERWGPLTERWQVLVRQLEAVAQGPRTTPQALGVAARALIEGFGKLAQEDALARQQYLEYLGVFVDRGELAAAGAVATRDAAFATMVGTAVVLAAPAVGTTAAAGTAAAGLTGTAASYGTAALTWSSLAALGAGLEGSMRAVTQALIEAQDALAHAEVAGQRALTEAEGVSWSTIGSEGWEGMKRGFVNGPLGLVLLRAEIAVAGPAGRLLDKLLGPVEADLTAKVLRQAEQAAIAGGASGAVVGAIRYGLHAAIAGRPFSEVVDEMERGFANGALSGAAVSGGLAGHGAYTAGR